jgi:hypothetical protein
MFSLRNIAMSVAGAAFLLGLTGCGDKTARDVAAMNKSNIQRVANLYTAFQTYKNGRGPADEAEFKAFIKEFDPARLKMMGVDPNNLDALFTSERDGKPLTLRYAVGGGRGASSPVAFEGEGKDGKKQVAFTGGKVETVDESTYQDFLAGKVETKPAAGGPTINRPTGVPAGAPTGPEGK